jgi:hypothetical protein
MRRFFLYVILQSARVRKVLPFTHDVLTVKKLIISYHVWLRED